MMQNTKTTHTPPTSPASGRGAAPEKNRPNELINPPPRTRGQSVWTPERRAAAAMRIRQNRPWRRSTGPRTADGKAKASRNAVKHGKRAAPWRRFAALLAWHSRLLAALKRCSKARLAAARLGLPEEAWQTFEFALSSAGCYQDGLFSRTRQNQE